MAEVLLRRVCPPRTRAARAEPVYSLSNMAMSMKNDDGALEMPETKAQHRDHDRDDGLEGELEGLGEPLAAAEPVPASGRDADSDDRHEALADGHDAVAEAGAEAEDARVAIAHAVSLSGAPELEVIREVPGEPSIAIEVAEHAESDSDSDDDTDSDDSDDSDTDSDSEDSASGHSESSSLKPQPSFFNHQPPRRSPLAQSSEGVFESVYKGYHCTISGCDFAASTAEHVRHHLRTASHWYLLDTGMD